MFTDHHLFTRGRANSVQLLERDNLFMGCDLEHGIARRVDDGEMRANMFIAQFFDDLCTGRGLIRQVPFAAGEFQEFVEDRFRKSIRVHRKRPIRDNAGKFPMSRRAVLSLGSLSHLSKATVTGCDRLNAVDRGDVPEAETLEVRKLQAADCAGRIRNRVRADIAVRGGIGKRSNAHAVQHDAYELTVCQESKRVRRLERRRTLSEDLFFVALTDLDKLPVEAIGTMRRPHGLHEQRRDPY
jgi:hypothetical protein